MEFEINKLYNENCLDTLSRMPDGQLIDLVVTSPPYNELRTYNGYSFDFESIAKELARVLKPGGVIMWNVADACVNGSETLTSCKQKIFFVEQCGLNCHDTMIYQKRNFSHPEKNRYHNVFEYMFIFSKGRPKTFNPIMDRKNITAGQVGNLGVNTFTMRDGSKSERTKKLTKEFGMRHNVWLGNTRGQEEMCVKLNHPAMMPNWVAADHIKSWSNAATYDDVNNIINNADIIYDPFAGSGTSLIQAKLLNRNWIGSEISKEYCELADGELAKLDEPKTGQLDLL